MAGSGPRGALRARRELLGLSAAQVARAVGVDRRTVYRWENGTSDPYRRQLPALARVLEWPLEGMGELLDPATSPAPPLSAPPPRAAAGLMLSEWDPRAADGIAQAVAEADSRPMSVDTAVRLAHVWLVTEPPQRLELAAGRRVGQRLADQAAGRVAQLRRMDDHIGGVDLQPAVVRDLAAQAAVVREGTYTDRVGRQLLTVLGELCQLAGRAAGDMGRPRTAAHYLSTGVAAGHAAGDTELAAECLSTLAYQVANTGPAGEAVLLAQSAVAGSRHLPGATSRALRLDRLAWAHARDQDRTGAERALGGAGEAFEGRDTGGDPDWAYWLDPVELDVMAGRCFTELGLPDRARPLLESALGSAYEGRPREAALYLSWLAEAELGVGDVDRAAAVAVQVLDLAGVAGSRRVEDRVHHVARLLGGHQARAARAFVEAYRDSLVGWAGADPT